MPIPLPYSVVLASASPRRKQLLKELVDDFDVVVSDVDEEVFTVADPYLTAQGLAAAKARVVFARRPDAIVIGGDTVVALPVGDGIYKQFSKPISVTDAEDMLGNLSGKTHFVVTGICVVSPLGETVLTDLSKVTFRQLSKQEISEYVATGIPMDKAGGYAIQDGAEGFVTHLDGSMSNVIGLPLEKLSLLLRSIRAKK